MPTISVGRDRLFAAIGRQYTDEEFDALCFEFGIEVDDITTEKAIIRKEKHLEDEVSSEDEEIIYKIEVPANRYDLLCLEGLSRALRIFNRTDEAPTYNVTSKASALQMHVNPETSRIRPYVVCAVLRGVTFDEARFNSFIDLQDRLHQNICRRRTLVAIGTHDLDTIHGPFTYEALRPEEINFIPLKQTKNFRADELMEFYKSDLKLKKFLHIIENSPVYPVIYDRNRTVLSLPPIINGAHSAITLKTKNVFIECTATDKNKANIVLNTMVTMFSEYCERKYEVEPVEIIYPDGKSYLCPDLKSEVRDVALSYINSMIKPLPAHEVASLLNKMQLRVQDTVSENNDTRFILSIPPTRSDVLHPIDVVGAVSNAYGYSDIDMELPAFSPQSLNQFSSTSLKLQLLKEFSDNLLVEFASKGGYTAVPTWTLCSHAENFTMLRRKDDKSTAVVIMDPKSADFEVVRTSLMPGLLKFLRSNLHRPKPISIFEVDDVVLLDEEDDVGASNHRCIGVLRCEVTSAFALIHGAVDKIMELAGHEFVSPGDESGYYLETSNEPQFLEEAQASVILKGKKIGNFGIVHPQVLENFGIDDPCSYAELDVESLL